MDKVRDKIDFIVGREIEVGGVYKGVVTSIKEYGAFVEFNGGRQGLLHISELSHEPVTRVSDVVTIGQQLSLMCIGQDVRGNIKLSLKATQPTQGTTPGKVVNGSVPSSKTSSEIWAVLEDSSVDQKTVLESTPGSKYEATSDFSLDPSFLIRSVNECDVEENTSNMNKDFKSVSAPPLKESESGCRLKTYKEDLGEVGHSTRILKIGTKLNAKVYQIRSRGLVLDLGSGIKGMFRFEKNGKKHIEIGDELRVECSSFTSKGIPVMSLVKDD